MGTFSVVIDEAMPPVLRQMLADGLRGNLGCKEVESGKERSTIADSKCLCLIGPNQGVLSHVEGLLSGKILVNIGGQRSAPSEFLKSGVNGFLGYSTTDIPFVTGRYSRKFIDTAFAGFSSLARGSNLGEARRRQESAWTSFIAKTSSSRDEPETTLFRMAARMHLGKMITVGDEQSRAIERTLLWPRISLYRMSSSSLFNGSEQAEWGPKAKDSSSISLVQTPRVELVDATNPLFRALQSDPELMHKIKPSEFEDLILDRLSAIGLGVHKVGKTNQKDGGVDIIAWPESGELPFLLAVQVKHSRINKAVGPGPVRELRGVVGPLPLDAGMLVTNTRFTADAEWAARNGGSIIRLRDFLDVKRWLLGQFSDELGWNEIPNEIELAPGVRVKIPKGQLVTQ